MDPISEVGHSRAEPDRITESGQRQACDLVRQFGQLTKTQEVCNDLHSDVENVPVKLVLSSAHEQRNSPANAGVEWAVG